VRKKWSFVVQKHAASHLHYDFRLELDGVLKSWAVPKGPSLDPAIKRLAMQVEDHPVAYGGFEGIIPQGEYGGGTVMLWDRGAWEPIGDPREGYRNGKLKFKLHGQKLRGGWMLIRTGGAKSETDRRRWLLFKERDDEARTRKQADMVDEAPLSVKSGRTMDEIAANRPRVWNAKAKTNGKAARHAAAQPSSAPGRHRTKARASIIPGQKSSKLPERVEVQLATLAKAAPEGDKWLHEIKLDGYRMICRIHQGSVEFISRNQQDWTERFHSLVEAAGILPVTQAILDGEVVAMRPDGTTDFQDLQNAFGNGGGAGLQYYAFDLLHLDGHDLAGLPLVERKRILARLLANRRVSSKIRFSEHIEGNGPAFFKEACKTRLEGIVSKRRDRPYQPGRGYDWLKVKCVKKEEFVIGGYSEPAGSRTGLGAVLVGYHGRQGKLRYAGKVGTGFDTRTLRSFVERLKPLQREQSPFADLRAAGKTHWVEPILVAQVAFSGWTNDERLRHPSFQGLREDKAAKEVTHDKAVPPPRVATPAKGKAAKLRAPAAALNGMPRPSVQKSTASVTSDGYNFSRREFAGVRLTNPDKVLYPEQGITKLELAKYYKRVAGWILPPLADRPLVLVRCPEGWQKECFYQKHPAVGTPETLRRIPIREKKRTEEYVIVDDVAGLISLAQIGALEIHAWGSRADKLEQPDRLIFDLDPAPDVPWSRVVQSARQVRQFITELGLESFVKTTGGKGLHLVIPIDRDYDWDEAKAFCKRVTDLIVAADPQRYTANMSKAARPGKIFIDYLRNGRGATAIAPYSTRARPDAPVSVPLAWKELSARIRSDHYTVRNIGRRLASLKRDPWKGIASTRQSLAAPLAQLQSLERH
jgi:bifunctional non-homologous end joining protein LigD